MSAGRTLAAALVILASAACGGRDEPAPLPALPGSAPTVSDLGRGVVDGFVAGDTARLRGYTLSLEEYRDVVWPRLGIDTTSGVTFGWSWGDNQVRGRRAYRRYLDRMKGMALRADSTHCTGAPRRFDGVTVMQGCRVAVRDSTGAAGQLELFSSVVEVGGRYKIFRYDD
ncbi:hypothetical protein [Longimicrobium terrae]|uniref:Uncharacterized protein n=1 Tax=Longimicrobium terrae TaxID=1639882 RepID=A0A841H363_9BACT|nr:hypothetical protein [Longimicrobium terrae]MBB6072444.1 hypothetical protein [Longimicrobium terrae]